MSWGKAQIAGRVAAAAKRKVAAGKVREAELAVAQENKEREQMRCYGVLITDRQTRNTDPRDYFKHWSGYVGTLRSMHEMKLRNPWGQFLLLWAVRFGEREMTVKNLEKVRDEVGEWFFPLDQTGYWEWNPSGVGKFLSTLEKKGTIGSYQMVRTRSTGGKSRWKVVNHGHKGGQEWNLQE
jgi:hypothetical protein